MRPQEPREASAVFVAHQRFSSTMSGDEGSEGWHDLDRVIYKSGASSMGGPSIMSMLGRMLGEGSLVRISVEVLDEKPARHGNPWRTRK